MKQQVAVIGLGRFGSSVARSLYNLGHDVLAIDTSEERVQSMMGQVSYPVTCNATEDAVLTELGITDYDAAVVAIGSDIVSSIMTSVLLKTMGMKYIVSRARNELHAHALELLGVDKIVHVEEEMGSRLAHNLFNPNVQEYLELTRNFGISRLTAPDRFVNMNLNELGFSRPRDRYGLVVLAIVRGNDITLNPDSGERIRRGDNLVISGRDEQLETLQG